MRNAAPREFGLAEVEVCDVSDHPTIGRNMTPFVNHLKNALQKVSVGDEMERLFADTIEHAMALHYLHLNPSFPAMQAEQTRILLDKVRDQMKELRPLVEAAPPVNNVLRFSKTSSGRF